MFLAGPEIMVIIAQVGWQHVHQSGVVHGGDDTQLRPVHGK